MREIKFRGKKVDTGEWIYGYYFSYERCNGVINHHIVPGEYSCKNMEYFYVIPESICQFTGLKDKNGKDIYEGDIVHSKNNGNEYVSDVKWGAGSRGWSLKYKYIEKCSKKEKCKYYSLPASHNIEVIGNIHDNPELTKQPNHETKNQQSDNRK